MFAEQAKLQFARREERSWQHSAWHFQERKVYLGVQNQQIVVLMGLTQFCREKIGRNWEFCLKMSSMKFGQSN